METFTPIPVDGLSESDALGALRMNCQGSLFYFLKTALRRKKLTDLHRLLCTQLEREHIKDVIEWPRDHFKTTSASEGLPMWKALPFSNQDEDRFRKHGYSEEFVRWMRRTHDPYTRILTVAENITNAAKIGLRTRKHFESNGIYRALFPETLPDSSCIWTNYSLHIKRPPGGDPLSFSPSGEGTFDFIGVGGALQSRHYLFLDQDDLIGRKAIESPTVMEKSIEYHQLLVGAFDSDDATHENDELIIGNRWGFHDLNSYVREHEPWFNVTSHSALGGCCDLHPPDTPIMPEWFSFEKLMRLKERLGTYHFSCQYLNNPAAPENADFRMEWLNYFVLKRNVQREWIIEYEVKDGEVRKDLTARKLALTLVVDPAHSGNVGAGRCRHAILVVGQDRDGNYYLIESWAQQSSFDTMYDMIFYLAEKWQIHEVGFESVAAQKFAIHHIQWLNLTKEWRIRVTELKGEVESPDGVVTKKKAWRIFNVIAPLAEAGRLFVQRKQQSFIGEYSSFSTANVKQSGFLDQLDAFAYAPQMLHVPLGREQARFFRNLNQQQAQHLGRPYSIAIH